jgi:metallo-beta-lactamase family protein
LIHDLKKSKLIPDIPVYINSPMAIKSTRIYSDHLEDQVLTPQECEEHCKVATYVSTPEESKALVLKTEPAIIISASGMASGGRVLHHLKALAPDPKNTILLVGYQAAGTRGEALLHRAETIKIHGQKIPVRAEIATINSLSAHADADEIMTWLSHFKKSPKMTFITHGEPLESEALRIRIQEELKWNTMVPEMGQMVTLSE